MTHSISGGGRKAPRWNGTAFACIAGLLLPASGSSAEAIDGLRLAYENKEPRPLTREIEAQIELHNGGDRAIDLDGVALHYHLDADGLTPVVDIRRRTPSVPVEWGYDADVADPHLTLRIADSVVLAPGARFTLRFRVEDEGGGRFDQRNDRSFIATQTSAGPNTAIGLVRTDSLADSGSGTDAGEGGDGSGTGADADADAGTAGDTDGTGGTTGGGSGDGGGPDTSLSGLVLRYENKAGSLRSRDIEATLELRNAGTAPTGLRGLTLRYFFDDDGLDPRPEIRRTIPDTTVRTRIGGTSAARYAEFTLASDTTLAPGARWILRFRIEDSRGRTFDQGNDPSFIADRTSLGTNDGIGLQLPGGSSSGDGDPATGTTGGGSTGGGGTGGNGDAGGGGTDGGTTGDAPGGPSDAPSMPVTVISSDIPISRSQRHTAQTPIAVHEGAVYFAQIEPGPGGDPESAIDLETRIHRGEQTGSGNWTWRSTLIEDRTAYDVYHTAPAVGVDETGHVHVAYNMHNFPWQYKVATASGSIDAFAFQGQPISRDEIARHKYRNKTSFPSLGSAAIPGNRITYPRFANDRNGHLYVSYRFAAKPARAFAERTMSSGVARYDSAARRWASLGGQLRFEDGDFTGPRRDGLRAIASQTGWTSYSPRLTFGPNGSMTVSSTWRPGTAGATAGRPCVVETIDGTRFRGVDGSPVPMPLRPSECGNVGSVDDRSTFYTIGDMASDSSGAPHLLLSRVGGKRELHRWSGSAWTRQSVPNAVTELFFDGSDNLWGLGAGLEVHVRPAGASDFRNVFSDAGDADCFPRAALDARTDVAYVYSVGCSANRSRIRRLDLTALLAD